MKKLGLIGYNLEYSLSPKIHSIIFNELGIKAKYGLISTAKDNLQNIIGALKSLDGFNITQPHKEDIIPYLDKTHVDFGVINTVKCVNGRMQGYNTDIMALESIIDTALSTYKNPITVIEGAGGTARMVIPILKKYTDKIYIVNRTQERGKKLAADTNTYFADGLTQLKPDVYINCSSKGVYESDYSFAPFIDTKNITYAFDAIYFETGFFKKCKELNLRCESGLSMLIMQAIFADEIFFDTTIKNKQDLCKLIESTLSTRSI